MNPVVKNYFWNEKQNRLRTFWRIGMQLIVWAGLLVLGQSVFLVLVGQPVTFKALAQPNVWLRLTTLLISVYLMAQFVDKRRFSDYGLNIKEKEWWVDFVFGIFIGGFLIVCIFLIMYSLGWLKIIDSFVLPEPQEIAGSMLGSLLDLTVVSVYVGLWIWSYTLRNIAEGFLFLNRLNPRAAVVGALLICLVYYVFIVNRALDFNVVFASNMLRAGLVLALPFLITRRLGMTIGLVLGWNFVQLDVFGFPAVGITDLPISLVHLVYSEPGFWTGYPAGLGAGMLAMAALMAASGLVAVYQKWRTGRVVFDGSLAYYMPPTAVSQRVSGNQLDPSAGG